MHGNPAKSKLLGTVGEGHFTLDAVPVGQPRASKHR